MSFGVMVIEVPAELVVTAVAVSELPPDWFDFHQYDTCQRIGGEWLRSGSSAVLRVPSAIIANESHYLLNPAHPDFSRIQLVCTEPFVFDPRLKTSPDV